MSGRQKYLAHSQFHPEETLSYSMRLGMKGGEGRL